MVDTAPVTPYPGHDDIIKVNKDVIIDFDDVRRSLENISKSKHFTEDNVDTVNEIDRHEKNKKNLSVISDADSKIESHKSHPTSDKTTHPPTSIYTVGGSNKHPKLELKAKEVSTRQCKFEIGEEWEQFQIIRDKSVSCPPSPLIGRRHDVIENGGRTNPGYAASEPGAEIDQDLTDSGDKAKDPFPFHFLFTSSSASSVKKCDIVPNPFNKVNQRFHSTLQCPCFLFFFFLCCLPAVHFMQQSDHQFKKGNSKRAKNYGRVSSGFYLVGTIIGVAFLVIAIYFAADYVKQFL